MIAGTDRHADSAAPVLALQRLDAHPADPGPNARLDTPWAYYWLLTRRSWWRIVTFTVIVTVVAALFTITRPKGYEAEATIQVDAVGAQVVGDNNVQHAADLGSESQILTEQSVLTSSAVLLGVIEKLHLQDSASFRDPGHPSAVPSVDMLLKELKGHLSIARPVGSLLLEVHYRANDPNLAAEIANAIAQSYLDLEYSTRAEALSQSSRYMTGQLDHLRAQMEQSQQALVSYESDTGILDPDNNDNIMMARLSQINSDLGKAQNNRMQLEAAVQTIRSGSADALATSELGQGLKPLEQNLRADERELKALAQIYGPNHPRYRQQLDLVNNDTQSLQAERSHIAAQVNAQYMAALAAERLLSAALGQQRGAMDEFNRRAIQYRSLKAAADSYSKLYYELLQGIAQSNLAAGFRSTSVRIVNPARASDVPVYPRPLLVTLLALLGSLCLSAAGVVALGVMDQSLTSAEQVEMLLGLPVLGQLPQVDAKHSASALLLDGYGTNRSLAAGQAPRDGASAGTTAPPRRSPLQESILSLHSAVMLAAADAPQVLAITSALPGEGKSTVAAHLASALAGLGERVLLVDADMRKPSVHRNFHIPNLKGLAQVLRGQMDFEAGLQKIGDGDGLFVLTSGPAPASPAELLHIHLPGLVELLRARFDRIVIDCPPALGFADATMVANQADAVLLVVRAGHTARSHVAGALRQLRLGRSGIQGVILNRVSATLNSYYNYYQAYEAGYYGNQDGDVDAAE